MAKRACATIFPMEFFEWQFRSIQSDTLSLDLVKLVISNGDCPDRFFYFVLSFFMVVVLFSLIFFDLEVGNCTNHFSGVPGFGPFLFLLFCFFSFLWPKVVFQVFLCQKGMVGFLLLRLGDCLFGHIQGVLWQLLL